MLGRSNKSRRTEKQNVQGIGPPEGLSNTQCEYTDLVVFSNACEAKFSQYSTTDWFSKSCQEWVGWLSRCNSVYREVCSRTDLVYVLSTTEEFILGPIR